MRLLLLGCLLFASTLPAQIGGTGADGAFDPTASLMLDTTNKPEFNFTSFRIRKEVVVRVKGSKPFIVRCKGEVWIEGDLIADGVITTSGFAGGAGGPGGHAGGDGHVSSTAPATKGQGPCGGGGATVPMWQVNSYGGNGRHAGCYGSEFPFSFTGGSGGGGGASRWLMGVPGGDGGGGVIAFFVDGKIKIDGLVSASSSGWYLNSKVLKIGGKGSGGSILLRSLTGFQAGPSSLILAEGHAMYNEFTLDHRKAMIRGKLVGYIRIDVANGSMELKGLIHPKPSTHQLPAQHVPWPPEQGKYWLVQVAGDPGDIAAIYWSWGLKKLNIPPFGLLELDLGKGFVFAGALAIPRSGLDPVGTTWFFAYHDKTLIGRTIHAQSLTLGLINGKPRLTNASSVVIK